MGAGHLPYHRSMTRSPLFSTYRQGENRVTASMLAVFERLDITVVERLLASASGEATLSLVTFSNQSSVGSGSVPDAVISGSFKLLFEVKTEPASVRQAQLEGHLAQLDGSHGQELLLVLTPDPEQPQTIGDIDDPRIIWFSFTALDEAIAELLNDPDELVGERSEFLLRELRGLFSEDGLLSWDDTVVVAARRAYDDYLRYSAYICQPGRSFKPGLTHLGFYRLGQIEPLVPAIRERIDNVTIDRSHDGPLGSLLERLIEDGAKDEGGTNQIFLLSPPDDEATRQLTKPIENTTLTTSGRKWAWTLGQRYVSLEALTSGVETTGELDAL